MLLFLAIVPSAAIFFAVWALKRGEKPPGKLLLRIFLFSALTTVSAAVIGLLGEKAATMVLTRGSLSYLIVDNFLLTAAVEEGGKYVVLRKTTWRNPAFRSTYDAVICAVAASLGFATVENIIYVLGGDMGDAITRALLSVPGHASYAVFMGCFYARARVAQAAGDENGAKRERAKALALPVLLHGCYDLCIDLIDWSDVFLILILPFCIALTVAAIRRVIRSRREDTRIFPDNELVFEPVEEPNP